jgi:hypothetical protein
MGTELKVRKGRAYICVQWQGDVKTSHRDFPLTRHNAQYLAHKLIDYLAKSKGR